MIYVLVVDYYPFVVVDDLNFVMYLRRLDYQKIYKNKKGTHGKAKQKEPITPELFPQTFGYNA